MLSAKHGGYVHVIGVRAKVCDDSYANTKLKSDH